MVGRLLFTLLVALPLAAQQFNWNTQIKNKPFETGIIQSERIVFFPTDDTFTKMFMTESAPKAGRHFTANFIMDLDLNVSAGAGDKVAGYFGVRSGPPATTQLNGGINNSTCTIVLDSSAIFHTSLNTYGNYPMRIKIDSEEIWVNTYNDLTHTVTSCTRGAFGSTAAVHSDNATVYALNDMFGVNVQCVKGTWSADGNLNCQEIDVHNFLEHYTDTLGQRSSVAMNLINAGTYIASHGLYINHTTATNSWFFPLRIDSGGPRGICVGPTGADTFDCKTYTGTIAGKQKANAGNFLVGQRFTDTTPTGNFFAFKNAAGSDLTTLDVAGNFSTAGSYSANGGAPYHELIENDAAANNRRWRIQADGTMFRILTANDAVSAGADVFTVGRSGTTPGKVSIHGQPHMSVLQAFANNAAALAGGLVAGDLYLISASDPRQLAVVF